MTNNRRNNEFAYNTVKLRCAGSVRSFISDNVTPEPKITSPSSRVKCSEIIYSSLRVTSWGEAGGVAGAEPAIAVLGTPGAKSAALRRSAPLQPLLMLSTS